MTQSMSSLLSRLNSSRSQRKPPRGRRSSGAILEEADRGLHPRIGASAGGGTRHLPRSRRGAASLPRAGGCSSGPCLLVRRVASTAPSAARASWESFDEVAVHEIVASTLARSAQGGWLDLDQAARLVEKCGVPAVPTRAAASADEAVAIAESMAIRRAESAFGRTGPQVRGRRSALGWRVQIRCAMRTRRWRVAWGRKWMACTPTDGGTRTGGDRGLASDPVFGPVVMVGLVAS